MSRILKVSEGDYRVQVRSGGNITLDTGIAVGTVVITGNLDVKGTTTTVESTNTTVKDNILELNYGQTGDGISPALGYEAGIRIGRGNLSDAEIIFDEQVEHYDQYTDAAKAGTFVLKTADGVLSGLQLQTITCDGNTDISIDMQGNFLGKVLRFSDNMDPINYADLLLQATPERDAAIPNKKFITLYVQSGLVTPGMADVDKIHKTISGVEKTRVQAYEYNIDFTVATALKAQINSNGLTVNNINIRNNAITSTGSTTMMIAAGLNLVTVDSVLGLSNQLVPPSNIAGQNKIYSTAAVGPGQSGIFFTNINTADELVAKNRALLFSMLF